MTAIDVIIPVYDGLQEVRNCIDSVLGAGADTATEIIVINDASPNPAMGELLDSYRRDTRVTLLENSDNLGFVRTVNRGMGLHPDRDVVLLNSDTVVSGNWLDRLHLQAYAANDVASVTPFSNNAEICSFPRLCQDNDLRPASGPADIDAALAGALPGRSITIPTAVGFCMYIRRAALEDVGYFDEEAFGLGYGEENDFCLRARKKGWRHVLAADCYVQHVGGVSFSERKQALVARAMTTLDKRYPGYHAEIASFIQEDPPYGFRCKGLIDLLSRSAVPKVLAITHQLGGGTERHVRELADCIDGDSWTLVLRPFEGSTLRLSLGLEQDVPGLSFDWADSAAREALLRLLRYIGISRLHVHHILGMEETVPELLTDIGRPYDITLHDYFLIDGNPTLTDEQGLYQPERSLRGAGSNAARRVRSDSAWNDWQAAQRRFLDGAERVFVPSEAALAIYRSHYPLANAVISWHRDLADFKNLPVSLPAGSPTDGRLRVLVLGALGVEKGADLLEEVALLSGRESAKIDFTLLGYAYRPLVGGIDTLGPYRDEELDALIQQQQPDLIWFPCRWPETYSYTLSAALKAGCPLLVPKIGAFPERVEGRPLTWSIPWQAEAKLCLDTLLEIQQSLAEQPRPTAFDWAPGNRVEFAYDTDYITHGSAPDPGAEFSLEDVSRYLSGASLAKAGRRRRLLLLLLRLKSHPALAWIARLIPYRLQRAVKRRLSRQPLHDVVP